MPGVHRSERSRMLMNAPKCCRKIIKLDAVLQFKLSMVHYTNSILFVCLFCARSNKGWMSVGPKIFSIVYSMKSRASLCSCSGWCRCLCLTVQNTILFETKSHQIAQAFDLFVVLQNDPLSSQTLRVNIQQKPLSLVLDAKYMATMLPPRKKASKPCQCEEACNLQPMVAHVSSQSPPSLNLLLLVEGLSFGITPSNFHLIFAFCQSGINGAASLDWWIRGSTVSSVKGTKVPGVAYGGGYKWWWCIFIFVSPLSNYPRCPVPFRQYQFQGIQRSPWKHFLRLHDGEKNMESVLRLPLLAIWLLLSGVICTRSSMAWWLATRTLGANRWDRLQWQIFKEQHHSKLVHFHVPGNLFCNAEAL